MANKDSIVDEHQLAEAEQSADDSPSDLVMFSGKEEPLQRFLRTPELVLEVARNVSLTLQYT